jgi:hypothetical protein
MQKDLVEEILPSTNVRAIHLSPDAPEVDIDYELIEVQETIVGLAYKEASPYTEVSTGTVKVTFKRASDGEVLASYRRSRICQRHRQHRLCR